MNYDENSALIGCLHGYKTLVDGTLRITVDFDENQAALFHRYFPGINLTVVVVRLNEEPAPAR